MDLKKRSLPCNPKISESTTTINDFIPLSTITICITINNDNKIPTSTPYHTSNNYNNVNDKDLSRAKVEVHLNQPGPISDSGTIYNSTQTTFMKQPGPLSDSRTINNSNRTSTTNSRGNKHCTTTSTTCNGRVSANNTNHNNKDTTTNNNTNKCYTHRDNFDPLQSNQPQIQIIGIVIDERDNENDIEDRNDNDSYNTDGIYNEELWGYKDSDKANCYSDDDNNDHTLCTHCEEYQCDPNVIYSEYDCKCYISDDSYSTDDSQESYATSDDNSEQYYSLSDGEEDNKQRVYESSSDDDEIDEYDTDVYDTPSNDDSGYESSGSDDNDYDDDHSGYESYDNNNNNNDDDDDESNVIDNDVTPVIVAVTTTTIYNIQHTTPIK